MAALTYLTGSGTIRFDNAEGGPGLDEIVGVELCFQKTKHFLITTVCGYRRHLIDQSS